MAKRFEWIYLTGLIIGSVVRVIYTRPSRANVITDDRKSGRDMRLAALPGLGFLLPLVKMVTSWLDFADYRLPGWAGWLGALLMAGAQWLLWRSHADLGRNWSPSLQIREEHTLVTQGVYRYIRHPMYAAHWLWALAQILLIQNWIAGWALLVSMQPLYWVRVPQEEQMMLDTFGEAYGSYLERTGRILPRI